MKFKTGDLATLRNHPTVMVVAGTEFVEGPEGIAEIVHCVWQGKEGHPYQCGYDSAVLVIVC